MTADEIARLRTRAQINGLLRKREALSLLAALEQARAALQVEIEQRESWKQAGREEAEARAGTSNHMQTLDVRAQAEMPDPANERYDRETLGWLRANDLDSVAHHIESLYAQIDARAEAEARIVELQDSHARLREKLIQTVLERDALRARLDVAKVALVGISGDDSEAGELARAALAEIEKEQSHG